MLDYAVLVISGADGVQGHTRTLWRLLKRYGIPVFLFVNKMDQNGTDKELLMEHLKKELDDRCVDFDCASDSGEFLENVAVCEEQALECLKKVVEKSRKPLVMDADALNLLAEENGKELAEKLRTQGAEGRIIILTPHVGELSRLLAKTIPECKKELPECGRELAERFHGVAVAKDARTIVCKLSLIHISEPTRH